MRAGTQATIATMAIALGATAAAAPAGAAAERMQLDCDGGSLAGHTLERTNGSSWWDVGSGDVYTTKSIVVSSEEEGTVYAKDHGTKAGGSTEGCTATHFEFTWQLQLVRVGK
jgi:hypothetical protein